MRRFFIALLIALPLPALAQVENTNSQPKVYRDEKSELREVRPLQPDEPETISNRPAGSVTPDVVRREQESVRTPDNARVKRANGSSSPGALSY